MERSEISKYFGPGRLESMDDAPVGLFASSSRRPDEGHHLLLLGDLQLDNSSLQPDRDGMCSVLGAKFREDVRDVALHACLAD